MSSYLESFTGECVHPLRPLLDSLWIEDIAHHLSNICRFSGATSRFYSVAEHSVRVCLLLRAHGEDESVQKQGLLHDGSEYVLGDWPTPLKHSDLDETSLLDALTWAAEAESNGDTERAIHIALSAAYRAAERRLMRDIRIRFGLHPEEPSAVRYADAVLLATEVRDLMPNRPQHWHGLAARPLEERIVPWPPAAAEEAFLKLFRKLDLEA